MLERFWRWLRTDDAPERYLASATDLADLERRMRELGRGGGRPLFVTFNQ